MAEGGVYLPDGGSGDATFIASEEDLKQMKIYLMRLTDSRDKVKSAGRKGSLNTRIQNLCYIIHDVTEHKPVPRNWKEHISIVQPEAPPASGNSPVIAPVDSVDSAINTFQHQGCKRKLNTQNLEVEIRTARVLIIANEFSDNQTKVRHGCQLDHNKAYEVLIKQLGYENFIETVIAQQNDTAQRLRDAGPTDMELTAHSIKTMSWTIEQMRILVKAAVTSPCPGDAVIIIIDTHGHSEGDKTFLYGEDERSDTADTFLAMLDDQVCHVSLKGKPKFLIVQACRGNTELQYNKYIEGGLPPAGSDMPQADAGANVQEEETEEVKYIVEIPGKAEAPNFSDRTNDEVVCEGVTGSRDELIPLVKKIRLDGKVETVAAKALQSIAVGDVVGETTSSKVPPVKVKADSAAETGVKQVPVDMHKASGDKDDQDLLSEEQAMNVSYTTTNNTGDASAATINPVVQETSLGGSLSAYADQQPSQTFEVNSDDSHTFEAHAGHPPESTHDAPPPMPREVPEDFGSVLDARQRTTSYEPALAQFIPDTQMPVSCPKNCIILYSTPFSYTSLRGVSVYGDHGSTVLQKFLDHLEECIKQHGDVGVPLLQLLTAMTRYVVVEEYEMPEVVHRLVRQPVLFRK